MKKCLFLCILLVCIGIFAACLSPDYLSADRDETNDYQRFREMYLDVFDTLTVVVGYAQSREQFDYFSRDVIRAELQRLHQLFDIFNEYEGINNIRTINNNAGIAPVEVDPVIIELLQLSVEAYHISGGLVNVAIGPVTNIWRGAISEGVMPNMEDLLAAGRHTDISDIIINKEMNTVFLQHEAMSLDVGSIAKGFAVELAAQAAIAAGFDSFSLTVGGDVRVAEGPRGGDRDVWGIGVSNPEGGDRLSAVFTTNTSIFSSGDYMRYFMADGQRFHHIIDPRTLMPADAHRMVTVVYPDSGFADILSLVAFILDTGEAKEFLADFGAEAIWMQQDGTVVTTSGWGEQ